jgi:uncharacterized protein (TIGR02117 family)
LPQCRILLVSVSLLVGALLGCSAPSGPSYRVGAADVATIYVVGRDWHTDVVIPASELAGPLGGLERLFPGARYFSFGFGERNYVLARRRTFANLLLALWPGPGLMLVTGLRALPSEAFGPPHVVTLRLSETGRSALLAFLGGYFEGGSHGNLRVAARGPYPGSMFFASPGTYSAVYTCNTWTADALQAAGLPVTASGVLFAAQVMERAREVSADQERGSKPHAPPGLLQAAHAGS